MRKSEVGRTTAFQRPILAYHGDLAKSQHHRYRSWEHCYSYFRQVTRSNLVREREAAALHLGFYLASWGMYRGSSFLLQHAYTAHLGVIDCLASERFSPLWENDIGSKPEHSDYCALILDAVDAVRAAYRSFGEPTDTLVTKILLGTLGCLPACDRYFVIGFKSEGNRFSRVNKQLVARTLGFCQDNLRELGQAQVKIQRDNGVRYPLMKLADMYYWQIGYESALARQAKRK